MVHTPISETLYLESQSVYESNSSISVLQFYLVTGAHVTHLLKHLTHGVFSSCFVSSLDVFVIPEDLGVPSSFTPVESRSHIVKPLGSSDQGHVLILPEHTRQIFCVEVPRNHMYLVVRGDYTKMFASNGDSHFACITIKIYMLDVPSPCFVRQRFVYVWHIIVECLDELEIQDLGTLTYKQVRTSDVP